MLAEMTDRPCGHCGTDLWTIDRGAGAVTGCPTCDRPRCIACSLPFGYLFARFMVRLHYGDDGTRCDDCLTEALTRGQVPA